MEQEYLCINCNKPLTDQEGFNSGLREWFCTQCGELNILSKESPWSFEEDERKRKLAAEEYFRSKSEARAAIREENAKRRDAEKAEIALKDETLRQKNAEARQKKLDFIKKYWKVIAILVLAVVVVTVTAAMIVHFKKLTYIGIDSESVAGMDYTQVVESLELSGFSDITAEPVADLSYDDISYEATVAFVNVDGLTDFSSDDRFSYDCEITVYYHTLMKIVVPVSAKSARSMNYQDFMDELTDAGFVNIVLNPLDDVKLGLFAHDGNIKTVSIDGNEKFKTGDEFRPDAEVVITYHSRPSAE